MRNENLTDAESTIRGADMAKKLRNIRGINS